ncbi:hypothetical protein M0805_001372 [Coniferiporia weirii]|nr:hypothetical protein M0805_001372 [Coniferiporia weirii]
MSGIAPSLQTIQNITFVTSNIASILYGAYICLALTNIYYLLHKKSPLLLTYTILLLCVSTVYTGVTVNYSQKQIIDDPTNQDLLSVGPKVIVRDSAYSINTWLVDGYSLFRCYIIWVGRYQTAVMTVPILIYLGSVGTSIALLVFSANPGANYSTRIVQVFGTANWSLSLSLNVILTALIAGRLLRYRSRLRNVFGLGNDKLYTAILAASVESAALYAMFEVMVLASFLTNSLSEQILFAMTGNVQVIAPNLIILRVAKGISFASKNSVNSALSAVEFTPPGKSTVTSLGSSTQIAEKAEPYCPHCSCGAKNKTQSSLLARSSPDLGPST